MLLHFPPPPTAHIHTHTHPQPSTQLVGGVLQLRAGWGAGGGVLVVMVVVAERTFLFEALLWAAMATSQLIFFSTESFLKEGQ